ncbi:MAG: nitronate monooxygenase, partial [Clostridia bacterium]|nr:nitronate monooxygenase [Clostridia bacterium]
KRIPVEKCTGCLKSCSKSFCIKTALENAQMGHIEKGLVFAGINVHKICKILPVKNIINELIQEFEAATKRYGGL